MKKLLCIALIFFALAPVAFAQQDTTAMPKWEVGLDLLWLVDKNTMPATSMFLRKHTTSKTGKPRAYRVRLGIEYSASKQTDTVDSLRMQLSLDTYVYLGYEWRRELDRRLLLFYGLELPISYHSFLKGGILLGDSGLYKSRFFVNGFTTGLAGLIGVQYKISKRLSASVESNAMFTYSYRKNHYHRDYYISDGSTHSEFGLANTYSYALGFHPISTINLSYHF